MPVFKFNSVDGLYPQAPLKALCVHNDVNHLGDEGPWYGHDNLLHQLFQAGKRLSRPVCMNRRHAPRMAGAKGFQTL